MSSVPTCTCGHDSTSLTQMKRHRAKCDSWKTRDKKAIRKARIESTLQKRYGVTSLQDVPGVKEKIKTTNLEKYGSESVFSKDSSIYTKVQLSLEGKRYVASGENNPFARPEVQAKIRETNLAKYGCAIPTQNPEVMAKVKATNLDRYGSEHSLSSPEIRAKICATNQLRYGGNSPAHSAQVVEKARQTNLDKWGVEWTSQHPEVRAKQYETQKSHYGELFFASKIGKQQVREALIAKYGVDHPSKIDDFWTKSVATFQERYGVSHPLQLLEFLDKRRETCQERFGYDSPMQSPEVYAKAVQTYRDTCIEKYGVHNAMMVPEIAEKALNIACRSGPNKLEVDFHLDNPELEYVGDGSFWRWLPRLGHHKNPDFIDTSKSRVVELFGDYWHSRIFTGKANFEHESELINAYADVGISCIIVWESEYRTDPIKVRGRVCEHLEVV